MFVCEVSLLFWPKRIATKVDVCICNFFKSTLCKYFPIRLVLSLSFALCAMSSRVLFFSRCVFSCLCVCVCDSSSFTLVVSQMNSCQYWNISFDLLLTLWKNMKQKNKMMYEKTTTTTTIWKYNITLTRSFTQTTPHTLFLYDGKLEKLTKKKKKSKRLFFGFRFLFLSLTISLSLAVSLLLFFWLNEKRWKIFDNSFFVFFLFYFDYTQLMNSTILLLK